MSRIAFAFLLISAFAIGRWTASSPAPELNSSAHSQAEPPAGPSFGINNETIKAIRAAYDALQTAQQAIDIEGKYAPATEGVNSFLVLTGGGNPLGQLEAGLGVDPETFAALHAGRAIPEVKDFLGYDAEGRLTYKNQLVKMIPVKDLQAAYELREKLLTARLRN